MAKSRKKVWSIEPHTEAKHEILRKYLDAWFPIMARWNGRVVYIDGFAGPGRYAGGEDGSPLIALKAAIEHPSPISSELVYLFIEADEARKSNLEQEVAKLSLPTNVKYQVHCGRFDETVTELLDAIERAGAQVAPIFAFVDPFGWSHTPFDLIARLLKNPRCEVLINFMYKGVNRFVELADHAHHFDRLFGTGDWRRVILVQGSAQRRQLIHDVYEQQLRTVARFVRSFEMRNRKNATDYYLFFATNNQKGLVKMKEAMWHVDPGGAFRFSDATAHQPVLFEKEPDYAQLRRLIVDRFTGQTTPVEEIEKFVIEETAFLPTHFKRGVLAKMEKEQPPSLDVVSAAPRRRRGTFPEGTEVRFL